MNTCIKLLCFGILTLFFTVEPLKGTDLISYVNPFIGTTSNGNTFPGVALPFGMVQLSPDTDIGSWDQIEGTDSPGYIYTDSTILGFSHTHLSGTGCPDYGNILVMPTTGDLNIQPGSAENPEDSYRSRFYNESEKAVPGYYCVWLEDYDIKTELTATRQSEMIRSLLVMYDLGGRIPLRVTYMNHYTNIMIGDHAVPVIVDSYMKNISEFDVQKAYEAIILNATVPDLEEKSRDGLEYYKHLGYIPADRVREGTSVTLENSYVDWTIAQMAKEMGKMNDYKIFIKRSQNYKNLFDPETGFMRPKLRDGSWLRKCEEGESPELVSSVTGHCYYNCFHPLWVGLIPHRYYVESNAWQYFSYVPHDIQGLINLYSDEKHFINRLDSVFQMSPDYLGPEYPDYSGAIGQYVHGNEPSHHKAYLFNYVGQSWKTQYWVRYIMDNLYGIEENGLPGNEDMGQMSAWFIMSAMGFYPVAPGQSVYQIGSPLFEKVTINLGKYYDNKVFTIETENVSKDNIYIQSASINGEPLERSWVTHKEIVNGGILEFEMDSSPNYEWGASPELAPPSMSESGIR